MSRHAPLYPKKVISLQGKFAASARNYRETPSEENFVECLHSQELFLRAKAQHHVKLAEMFEYEANCIADKLSNAS